MIPKILGPVRQINSAPILRDSPNGFYEIYAYGFIPEDLYSIFLDRWFGEYKNQIVLWGETEEEAERKMHRFIDIGRFKIATDPILYARQT